jgi:hypothetical protein
MSYNGTGTFNINTAGQPVVTGTTITSTAFNLLTADLASGLTTALTKDGQTTPTANIPMGTYKITGLGAGTSATDAAQYGQLQAGATTIATVTGTDTLAGTLTPAPTAYATGNKFSFIAAATNTGAATININSLGAKSITKSGTSALVAGDMVSGQIYLIEYDGTRFQLLNPSSAGVSTISFGSTGLTPSTATGGAVTVAGTLAIGNGGTGAATLSANAVLLGNGTSALQTVAPSTSGNVLTSNGTTWASTAPSSGMALIASVSVTAVTNIDTFISSFSSTYGTMLLVGENISASSSDTLSIRFASSGTPDTASNYGWNIDTAAISGNTTSFYNSDDAIRFMGVRTATNQPGASFHCYIHTPATSGYKYMEGSGGLPSSAAGTSMVGSAFMGAYKGTSGSGGIRIFCYNGSTFTAQGKFFLYGLRA